MPLTHIAHSHPHPHTIAIHPALSYWVLPHTRSTHTHSQITSNQQTLIIRNTLSNSSHSSLRSRLHSSQVQGQGCHHVSESGCGQQQHVHKPASSSSPPPLAFSVLIFHVSVTILSSSINSNNNTHLSNASLHPLPSPTTSPQRRGHSLTITHSPSFLPSLPPFLPTTSTRHPLPLIPPLNHPLTASLIPPLNHSPLLPPPLLPRPQHHTRHPLPLLTHSLIPPLTHEYLTTKYVT